MQKNKRGTELQGQGREVYFQVIFPLQCRAVRAPVHGQYCCKQDTGIVSKVLTFMMRHRAGWAWEEVVTEWQSLTVGRDDGGHLAQPRLPIRSPQSGVPSM